MVDGQILSYLFVRKLELKLIRTPVLSSLCFETPSVIAKVSRYANLKYDFGPFWQVKI